MTPVQAWLPLLPVQAVFAVVALTGLRAEIQK